MRSISDVNGQRRGTGHRIMCGIVGILAAAPLGTNDVANVRRANLALTHRGPDGSGEFQSVNGQLFMAMRRLSIIDLAGGWQPLFNEDRSLVLIANGEIYNFVELRAELSQRGHRFLTNSDCEVILHAYAEYGFAFVRQLRGMFAFALWDVPRGRLILARDRMGEKPLYLHHGERRLTFGSELRAMLASRAVPFELHKAALFQYLHYGWVPEPATMVQGLVKLRPGHLLVVDTEPWQVREECYWRLEDAPAIAGDPAELLRDELEIISRQILRADVPVGIALSGGFDSSLLAALAAKHYPGRMRAFSVGYAGRPHQDERRPAQAFAERIGMDFHEIELDLPELLDVFPALSAKADDPIADIAAFGYFKLSEHAREQGCPVLLQGQGGDELFWGYPWTVEAVKISEQLRAGYEPGALGTLLRQLQSGPPKERLLHLASVLGGKFHGWKDLVPKGSAGIALYELTDGYQIAKHSAAHTFNPLFSRALREENGTVLPPRGLLSESEQRVDVQVVALLCRGYLQENGLAQGDRLAMANSVELRVPLSDYRLAELSVGLQKTTPCFALPPKQWLKDATRDLLPSDIVTRPKRGFNPPVARWLEALARRHGAQLINGYLVQQQVLAAAAAKTLWRFGDRFSPDRELGFRYLVLEFWCRAMSELC